MSLDSVILKMQIFKYKFCNEKNKTTKTYSNSRGDTVIEKSSGKTEIRKIDGSKIIIDVNTELLKLSNLDGSQLDTIYGSISTYIKELIKYINNPDFKFEDLTLNIDVTSYTGHKPHDICGLNSRTKVSCDQLHYLRTKNEITLIPMMYHVLQGYRLIYQLCGGTRTKIIEIENMPETQWLEAVKNLIEYSLGIFRKACKTHEFNVLSKRIRMVIHQIRYLRAVEREYCALTVDGKNDGFNTILEHLHTFAETQSKINLPTGTSTPPKVRRR